MDSMHQDLGELTKDAIRQDGSTGKQVAKPYCQAFILATEAHEPRPL
jgi:hypothetical protein